MAKKRFTMDDYYARLDEVRERHRVKPAVTPQLDRLRQVMGKKKGQGIGLPKLPKV